MLTPEVSLSSAGRFCPASRSVQPLWGSGKRNGSTLRVDNARPPSVLSHPPPTVPPVSMLDIMTDLVSLRRCFASAVILMGFEPTFPP